MIELHLHLDGSLPPALLLELARSQGIPLPAETEAGLLPYLTAPAGGDLNAYLSAFRLPLLVLQTAWAVERAVGELLGALAKEGMIYAEIRFAPQLHTEQGCSQEEIVLAAIRAVSQAPILAKLILCCMRGAPQKQNFETLHLAQCFLGQGVAGLDLAGAEGLYPTCDYSDLFSAAARASVPFTIHAGEAAGPESIRAALSFGAKRIGHGIAAMRDPDLLAQLRREKIALEMCPTSNLQTGAISSIRSHPALPLLRQGLRVTISSDNRTVSNTTLRGEFALLKANGMTSAEAETILDNALDAAFLSSDEHVQVREKCRVAKQSGLWYN